MHDVTFSNIAELSAKIIEHGVGQGAFHFSIVRGENGDVTTLYEFGREAPGSPMYGGASYGAGRNVEEALREVARECGLIGEGATV